MARKSCMCCMMRNFVVRALRIMSALFKEALIIILRRRVFREFAQHELFYGTCSSRWRTVGQACRSGAPLNFSQEGKSWTQNL